VRAECPVCGGSFRLYDDGTLRSHGPLGEPCEGSGSPIVDEETVEAPPTVGVFERLAAPRPAWFADAECRPENRPDWISPRDWTAMFYPTRGEVADAARELCVVCPVSYDCLGLAVADRERFGVWGGTSERQRRSARSAA
jgi:hypothetical protein